MDFGQAILLGLIEGATEFLPVSSTGHLILASKALAIPDSAFLTSFIIAVQFGAIAAVLLTYWRSFLKLELLKKLLVAFIPTGIIGFTLYPIIKGYLLGNELIVLISLFIGGIVLIIFDRTHKESDSTQTSDITYRQAFLIGIFQSFAIIPGVSRSAATIVGGLSLGISRIAIIEFSFLLAVPTMGAATSYDLLKNYQAFAEADVALLMIGMVTAFGVALIVLQLFLRFVKRYSFTPFGVYRILLAVLFFFVIL